VSKESRKINILMISARSDVGGGPKHLYDLSRTLKLSNSFSISIASPDDSPFGDKFKHISDHFLDIPKRSFTLVTYIKLLLHCREFDIDVIHSHGRGAGIYSRLLSLFGYKVIHTFHGIHHTPNFTGTIKVLADRILAPLTDQFICVSDDEKIKALDYRFASIERTNVIQNGIDIDSIHDTNNRGTTKGIKTIGTLARLNYQKGLDIAIKHMSELDLPIKLLIAGDGEEKETLLALIEKYSVQGKVEFIGMVAHPSELFEKIDAYISTARWEGLPLSVLESMAYPNACLLSNVTGHKQLSKNGSCVLFDLNDFQSFRLGIEKLLISKKEIEKKALLLVRKDFGLEMMVQKTSKVYQKTTYGV
jgi:glycosyltransferase involved in cell wall biosynthesis